MRVVDRLADREEDWKELQLRLARLERGRVGQLTPGDVLRLGELYRSSCADLMLAEAHDLPRDAVSYLHSLVGRAHNAVYRARGFRLAEWGRVIFEEVPARLRADPMLRVSAMTFWGLFLICAFVAAARPGYAAKIHGDRAIEAMEEAFDRAFDAKGGRGDLGRDDSLMAGFYIAHNAGIGLSCYAWGLLFGIGSLWTLASNAIILGSAFGHMATTPQAGHFFTFVTAHGPFELTAIVFAGAAGLRLGSGLVFAGRRSRMASLRVEAANSLPIAGVSVILFVLAAFLEGFVSASPLPYWSKAGFAIVSASVLAVYLVAPGRWARRPPAVDGIGPARPHNSEGERR